MTQRTEIIDGREFVVTTLPQDKRLEPGATRKRALWNRLTAPQKAAYIRQRKAKAKRRRMQKR